jgi:hypothetical protein
MTEPWSKDSIPMEPPPDPEIAREVLDPPQADALDFFIHNFLAPILRDCEIESLEETPLIVAFHALGIDALFRAAETEVRGRMLAATRPAGPCPSRAPIREAWEQIRPYAARMTANDTIQLRAWLNREAAGLGQSPLPEESMPEPTAGPAVMDRSCIAIFYRLLADLKREAAPESTLEVERAAHPAITPEPHDRMPLIRDVPDMAITAQAVREQMARLCAETEMLTSGLCERLRDGLPGLAFDECRPGSGGNIAIAGGVNHYFCLPSLSPGFALCDDSDNAVSFLQRGRDGGIQQEIDFGLIQHLQ